MQYKIHNFNASAELSIASNKTQYSSVKAKKSDQ